MAPEIRILGPEDVTAWREIRQEGLRAMPEAFLTTYEEERAKSDEEVAERLSLGAIRGAYAEGTLAAVLAYIPMTAAAAVHRGELGAFLCPARLSWHRRCVGPVARHDRGGGGGRRETAGAFRRRGQFPGDHLLRAARVSLAGAASAGGAFGRSLAG